MSPNHSVPEMLTSPLMDDATLARIAEGHTIFLFQENIEQAEEDFGPVRYCVCGRKLGWEDGSHCDVGCYQADQYTFRSQMEDEWAVRQGYTV